MDNKVFAEFVGMVGKDSAKMEIPENLKISKNRKFQKILNFFPGTWSYRMHVPGSRWSHNMYSVIAPAVQDH